MRNFFLITIAATLSACAHRRAISGTVINRNGEPVDRVIVSLEPGNVEIVTDSYGGYRIDYLRDGMGNRVPIDPRSEYHLEVFRPGFHVSEVGLYFRRGQLIMEPITLIEDSIRIQTTGISIDPADYPDRTHSTGASYEGE